MFSKALLALTALAGFASAELSLDRLVFSEVLFRPTEGDRGEFVELYNPTGEAIDTGAYSVCTAADVCVNLAGMLAADSYYVICSDISTYAFCRQASTVQLGSSTQLKLLKNGESADVVTTPGTPPIGMAYARGLDSDTTQNGLLKFSYTEPSVGVGFLGGATVTAAPSTAPPPPVAGVSFHTCFCLILCLSLLRLFVA